ncbi:MAG: hypothetical protein VW268_11885 [Rhodospirillaceae bacterium]
MESSIPLSIQIIDYILGAVMWTLIGRSGMNLFLPVDSPFFFMRAFVMLTEPVLKVFRPITPKFLLDPMVPLYVAWFFYIIRFYLMPWILGYSVMGMLSFPLEGDIARAIYEIFGSKPK